MLTGLSENMFIKCVIGWGNGQRTENYDQLFDLFAPEHFLGICSEEIRETIWDVSLGFVQEVADLVYFYVQNQSVQ